MSKVQSERSWYSRHDNGDNTASLQQKHAKVPRRAGLGDGLAVSADRTSKNLTDVSHPVWSWSHCGDPETQLGGSESMVSATLCPFEG